MNYLLVIAGIIAALALRHIYKLHRANRMLFRECCQLARLAGSLAQERDQWRAVCLSSSDDLAALLCEVEDEWPETLEVER